MIDESEQLSFRHSTGSIDRASDRRHRQGLCMSARRLVKVAGPVHRLRQILKKPDKHIEEARFNMAFQLCVTVAPRPEGPYCSMPSFSGMDRSVVNRFSAGGAVALLGLAIGVR